ncbi:acetate/propionate family kinase [Granulicella aggregans]|jgi:acetate kinase|uniref:acetate/propionate family kinase n=1 Tax=Granulicella aggregans TaxID=474949 RepID=UPI0021DFED76|nr:acetate/propionate family kinase [Granulicella aggregans]
MHVLVINSGSSSIKFSMFEVGGRASSPIAIYDGELGGVGTPKPGFKFADASGNDLSGGVAVHAGTIEEAIQTVEQAVGAGGLPKVDAVGYRVVHPGARLKGHQRITSEVLQALRDAEAFAPLHDPVAVEIIEEMMKRLPDVPHFACFDTVFHETMPEAAKTYAIPLEYREQGVRRYGFHGLSCESIIAQFREAGIPMPRRMVIAHLGSGCSVTALLDGKSVDTTMGLTPTGGVVMGTRPGDLDPGLMVYLLRQQKSDQAKEVEAMVNHKAGMVALSGMANDMRAVRAAAASGDAKAVLAVEVFVRSVRKAIGGFAFLMGGLDAVVFAGGIGEHDTSTRLEVMSGLDGVGILLDAAANTAKGDGLRMVSSDNSKTAVFVIPAAEDRMIAWHVREMTGAPAKCGDSSLRSE